MRKKLLFIVLTLSFSLSITSVLGTHVAGGDITYRCLGPVTGGTEYEITLSLYRDCISSVTLLPNMTVDFVNDCGYAGFSASLPRTIQDEVSQLCDPELPSSECGSTVASWDGFERNVYVGTITIPNDCDAWTVSWDLCCRNASTNVIGTTNDMYIEAKMCRLPRLGCVKLSTTERFLDAPLRLEVQKARCG